MTKCKKCGSPKITLQISSEYHTYKCRNCGYIISKDKHNPPVITKEVIQLIFKCELCKKNRFHKDISVRSKKIIIKGIEITENIKYCNVIQFVLRNQKCFL